MPIPANVIHVCFGGNMPGGEVWESGFWTAGATITSNDEANAYAELWWDELSSEDTSGAMYQFMQELASTSTTFQYVKAYCYPAGGTTAQYIGTHAGSPIIGTANTGSPNQVALVVTLRSAYAGRAHRGRMYLPATGSVVGVSGQLVAGVVNPVATDWGQCFSDWNAVSGNGIVSVVSRVGAGGHVPVTSVAVDSILDTQRRRRNKLIPNVVATAVLTH